MAYNNISSLTPSRPAPTPPLRPATAPSNANNYRSAPSSSSSAKPTSSGFSSTAYSSSFPILNPSSALGPSSSAGGSRNGTGNSKGIVRTGPASVKEEGLRSFLWSKRWLVLGGTELQIFKNEVSQTVVSSYRILIFFLAILVSVLCVFITRRNRRTTSGS